MSCNLFKRACVILIFYIFLGTVCLSLANLEGEESFDASLLGYSEEVSQERICDDELILIKGYNTYCTSIVIY